MAKYSAGLEVDGAREAVRLVNALSSQGGWGKFGDVMLPTGAAGHEFQEAISLRGQV